jgi:AraC family transcriptional regulator, arabinose operon regulatory protein
MPTHGKFSGRIFFPGRIGTTFLRGLTAFMAFAVCISPYQACAPQLVKSLSTMNRQVSGPLDDAALFAMNSLENAFLICKAFHTGSRFNRIDRRIVKALDILCAKVPDRVVLSDIARECGLSTSRFAHLFRREIGLAPMSYLEQQRIKKARQLLELTAHSITRIAFMTGFESQSYFTRRFSMATGKSPRAYRNEHQEEAKG